MQWFRQWSKLALFFAPIPVIAQSITVIRPILSQCETSTIEWNSGTAPFYISVLPGGQIAASPLEDLGTADERSITWNVDLEEGTSVTLRVADSLGLVGYSASVTVVSGSSSCLGGGLIPSAPSSARSSSTASVARSILSSATTSPTTPTLAASSTPTAPSPEFTLPSLDQAYYCMGTSRYSNYGVLGSPTDFGSPGNCALCLDEGGWVFQDPSRPGESHIQCDNSGTPNSRACFQIRPCDQGAGAAWSVYPTSTFRTVTFVGSGQQNGCPYDPLFGEYMGECTRAEWVQTWTATLLAQAATPTATSYGGTGSSTTPVSSGSGSSSSATSRSIRTSVSHKMLGVALGIAVGAMLVPL